VARKTRSDGQLELARGVDAQAIARQMEREHGCEGITMDTRTGDVLGLRYRDDVATTHVIKPLESFAPRRRSRGARTIFLPPRSRK
jgi:hypothetical protein